jgi:hypothetical protein
MEAAALPRQQQQQLVMATCQSGSRNAAIAAKLGMVLTTLLCFIGMLTSDPRV